MIRRKLSGRLVALTMLGVVTTGVNSIPVYASNNLNKPWQYDCPVTRHSYVLTLQGQGCGYTPIRHAWWDASKETGTVRSDYSYSVGSIYDYISYHLEASSAGGVAEDWTAPRVVTSCTDSPTTSYEGNEDTVPPTASASASASADKSHFIISVDAQDGLSGINTITSNQSLPAEGAPTTVSTRPDDSGAKTRVISKFTVPSAGTYTFSITDRAGKVSTASCTITAADIASLDTTPPDLNVSVDDSSWSKQKTINVSASDAGSGMNRIDGSGGYAYPNPSCTVNANGTYAFTAYDKLGNHVTKSVTINKIDNTAPSAPSIGVNKNILTVASGTDANSGVARTEYKINGGAIATDLLPKTLADGTYTITATTFDNAGNTSSTASFSTQVFETALNTAKTAVSNAESVHSTTNLTNAKNAVSALPSVCADKPALQARVNVVEAIMSVEKAESEVVKAESAKTLSSVASARVIVNALATGVSSPTGATKSSLTDRLNVVAFNTVDAEIKALTSLSLQSDIDKVQADIDTTKSDVTRNAILQAELNDVKALIATNIDKAKKKIDSLTVNSTRTDESDAQALINAVPTDKRDSLQSLLDAKIMARIVNDIADEIKNFDMVSGTLSNVDKIQDEITALPASSAKSSLQTSLNGLRQRVSNRDSLLSASASVVKAENSTLLSDVALARQVVNALPEGISLPDGTSKLSLTDRLNKVAYTTISAEIGSLTTLSIESDINKVQLDIDTTKNDTTSYNSLQLALDTLRMKITENIAKAQSKIDSLTVNSTSLDESDAQVLIDAVPSDKRDSLQSQLNDKLLKRRVYDIANEIKNFDMVTGTLSDIAKIQEEIDGLSDTPSKSTLQPLLDDLRKRVLDRDSLSEALVLVIKAEDSKLLSDVNSARTVVDGLPTGVSLADGTTKESLTERLNIVAYNTIDAEIKALTTLSVDSDIDKVQFDIGTTMSDTARYDILQLALDDLRAKINENIAKAQTKIDSLTVNSTSKDESDAQVLVDAVPTDKRDSLQSQLDAKILTRRVSDITNAINNFNMETGTLSDVDNIQNDIDTLPESSRDAVQSLLDALKQKLISRNGLRDALALVIKAENSGLLSDVAKARELVNVLVDGESLSDGTSKASLTNRLNCVVYLTIDAEIKALTTLSLQSEIDKVQADIDTTKDDVAKHNLLQLSLDQLIAKIKANIVKAKDKVDSLDLTSTSADETEAQNLINAVPADKRDSLQSELDAKVLARKVSDITNEIKNFDKVNGKLSDVNKIQDEINALPESSRGTLQALLDVLIKELSERDALSNAEGLVMKAEGYKLESDSLIARTDVLKLVPSAEKDALILRLDILDAVININKASANPNKDTIANAQTFIDKVTDTTKKAKLQSELDKITADLVKTVTDLVTKAIGTKDINDFKKASDGISSLPDNEPAKKILQDMLDKLQSDILVNYAKSLINSLTPASTPDAVQKAQDAVDKVADTAKKAELQLELDKKKKDISDLANQVKAVEDLIKNITKPIKASDLDNIQDLINKLPVGDDRSRLQEELDKLKEEYLEQVARESVERAENTKTKDDYTKTKDDYTKARADVAVLKDGTVKTDLTNRLDALDTMFSVDDISAMIDALTLDSPQEDIDTIQKAISSLPASADKDNLQTRLNDFIAKYNKFKADATVIENNLQALDTDVTLNKLDGVDDLITSTQSLITGLPECQTKKEFQTRLTNLINAIQALKTNDSKKLIDSVRDSLNLILGSFKATNDTTEQTVLSHVRNQVPEIVSLSISDFNKTVATTSSAGVVTCKLNITYNELSEVMNLNLPIDMLSSSSSSSSSSSHHHKTGNYNGEDTSNTDKVVTTSDSKYVSGNAEIGVSMDVATQVSVANAQLKLVLPVNTKILNSIGLNNGAVVGNYDWTAYKESSLVAKGQLGTLSQHNQFQGVVVNSESPLDTSTNIDLSLTGGLNSELTKIYSYNETLGKFIPSNATLTTINGKVTFNGTNKESYLLLSSKADALDLGVNGWNKIKNTNSWAYVESENCVTGWKKATNSTWYYLGTDGTMKTGWQKVDGAWYYLSSSGAMLHDTTVEGYALGSSGAML